MTMLLMTDEQKHGAALAVRDFSKAGGFKLDRPADERAELLRALGRKLCATFAPAGAEPYPEMAIKLNPGFLLMGMAPVFYAPEEKTAVLNKPSLVSFLYCFHRHLSTLRGSNMDAERANNAALLFAHEIFRAATPKLYARAIERGIVVMPAESVQ